MAHRESLSSAGAAVGLGLGSSILSDSGGALCGGGRASQAQTAQKTGGATGAAKQLLHLHRKPSHDSALF